MQINNYSELVQYSFPAVKGREFVLRLFQEGLRAVDPYQIVMDQVNVFESECTLEVDGARYAIDNRRIWVLGVGKAVGRMAEAIENKLAHKDLFGIICVPEGLSKTIRTSNIEVYESSHPFPSLKNVENTKKVIQATKKIQKEDLVIILISGGGSALWAAPIPPITISELIDTNKLLINSGMTIQEINTIRKHLSLIKGGKLAKLLPCETITLVLSDVIGDSLENIASGPTYPDPTTYKDAKNLLEKYNLLSDVIPKNVRQIIREGLEGRIEETVKPNDTSFNCKKAVIIGSNRIASKSIIRACRDERVKGIFLTDKIEGDARWVGKIFARIAIGLSGEINYPLLIVSGGEPTILVRGTGMGGRNQEVVVSFLQEVFVSMKKFNFIFLSAGTDGIDGNSPYAGAIIDNKVLETLRSEKLNIETYQEENDTSRLLSQLGGSLISTGPTGTNEMDLHLCLLNPHLLEREELL